MRAGIAIDDWKLPIFDRHLTQAGYAYENCPGLSEGTRMLYVITENVEALSLVVQAANDEAYKTRGAN